nr:hypothetical protein [Tanacetum cinerariifolium]
EPLQADQRHTGPARRRRAAAPGRRTLPPGPARRRRGGPPVGRRIRGRPVRHPPALRSHHGRAKAASHAGAGLRHRRPR